MEQAMMKMDIDEMMDELASYYTALGYPMYAKDQRKQMSKDEIINLYEMTFPNRYVA